MLRLLIDTLTEDIPFLEIAGKCLRCGIGDLLQIGKIVTDVSADFLPARHNRIDKPVLLCQRGKPRVVLTEAVAILSDI